MTLQKQLLTPTNLLEPQLFGYTANDLIKKFSGFENLNSFLEENPEIFKYSNSGFTCLVTYEGNIEIQLYQNIEKDIKPGSLTRLSFNAEIVEPSQENFIDAIKKCQRYIKEGDIYQANLAHKFLVQTNDKLGASCLQELYQKLDKLNPSPYNGFIETDNYIICSSSPESFLEINGLDNFKISSSPIKGTANLTKLNKMLMSAKEKAEHIMIVDLIRNDIGRIAKTGTVSVEDLLGIHKYENLYHFVSKVSALIKEENLIKIGNYKIPDFAKIFKACFPGGSITGAPKIRAMEIIKELEGCERGPYTGTMGFYKFSGYGNFNILIRSIVYNKKTNELSFHSGAGITSGSDPEEEYQETLLKAEKLIEVFNA